MSRLLIGNFDFEWSLAHPRQVAPVQLSRLASELAVAWLATAESDDYLLLPAQVDVAFLSELQSQLPWTLPSFVRTLAEAPREAVPTPWGWTEQIIAACQSAGLSVPSHPAVDVVRQLNSRRFSHELEQEHDCGLPLTQLVRTRAELQSVLRRYASAASDNARWIIKADLSNSSRERLVGRGPALSDRDLAWLDQRLTLGPVLWEPWVDIIAEAGLQWDVPRQGEPRLIGVTPLLADAAGHYRGSQFATSASLDQDWADAVAITHVAAQRIQSAGYFGPLGIDACRYRSSQGGLRLRPLQDINARWTMGRLSLGWRRWLSADVTGLWRHGPPEATLRESQRIHSPPLRTIRTSPRRIGDRDALLQHQIETYPANMS